jgi:hypothetical protein
MKKNLKRTKMVLLSVLVLAALSVFFVSSVFAVEANADSTFDTTVEVRTTQEVEIMHSSLGAQMRLLQLEREISKNIFQGERIIAHIDANTTVDTSSLVEYVDALKVLRAEVKTTRESLLDSTLTASESAAAFVVLKKESVSLTTQFRTELAVILSDEERAQLRSRVVVESKESVRSLHDDVKRVRNSLMEQRLAEVRTRVSASASTRIAEVNVSSKDELRIAFDTLSEEDRRRVAFTVEEAKQRREVVRADVAARADVANRFRLELDEKLRVAHQKRLDMRVSIAGGTDSRESRDVSPLRSDRSRDDQTERTTQTQTTRNTTADSRTAVSINTTGSTIDARTTTSVGVSRS